MSAELEKDVARELIVADQSYPTTLVLRLPIGRVLNSMMIRSSAASDHRVDLTVSQVEHSSKTLKWLEMPAQGGILHSQYRIVEKSANPEKGFLRVSIELRISLTERGKRCLLEKKPEAPKVGLSEAVVLEPGDNMSETIQGDFSQAFLKICTKNIIAVASLSFYDERNAESEYLWQYEKFTPLGELFRAQQLRFCPEFLKVINLRTTEKFNDIIDADIHRGRATFTLQEDGWRMTDLRD